MRDQRVWSVMECAEIFRRSVTELKHQLANVTNDSASASASDTVDNSGPPTMLVWDKVRLGDIVVFGATCTVVDHPRCSSGTR